MEHLRSFCNSVLSEAPMGRDPLLLDSIGKLRETEMDGSGDHDGNSRICDLS